MVFQALVVLLLLSAHVAHAQEPDPHPGAAPIDREQPWSDAALAQREGWVEQRIHTVKRERMELVLAGRPDYFRRRRGLGYAAIGVGAGVAGLSWFAVLLTITSHTNDGSLTDPQRRAFLGAVGTGVGTAAIGIWAVISARRSNLNQPRIDSLEQELDTLGDERRRLRREQKERARYGVVPGLSTVGTPLLALRVVW